MSIKELDIIKKDINDTTKLGTPSRETFSNEIDNLVRHGKLTPAEAGVADAILTLARQGALS